MSFHIENSCQKVSLTSVFHTFKVIRSVSLAIYLQRILKATYGEKSVYEAISVIHCPKNSNIFIR